AMIGLSIRKYGPRVCLAVAVLLIQHKRFHIEETELIQSLFVLVTDSDPAQTSGVGDDLLQICRYYQAGAFAIHAGNPIVERRRSETVRLRSFGDRLQLIEF